MNVLTFMFRLFVKHLLIRVSWIVTHDDANLTFDSHVSWERLSGVEKLFVNQVNCLI
jgi:hypothetical protein